MTTKALYLILILAAVTGFTWFAVAYRGPGKWWFRTNVILFNIIAVPAVCVGLAFVAGGFFDWIGFPGPLVWLIGMAFGEAEVTVGYFLGPLTILLGLVTLR